MKASSIIKGNKRVEDLNIRKGRERNNKASSSSSALLDVYPLYSGGRQAGEPRRKAKMKGTEQNESC